MQYIIYDNYAKSNGLSALESSTKALLATLGAKVITPKAKLLACEGYYARAMQEELLIQNVAYNLAMAKSAESTLLFMEEDAYANALYAKQKLDSSAELKTRIEAQFLHKFSYDSNTKLCYIADVLDSASLNITKPFANFSAALVHGGYIAQIEANDVTSLYGTLGLKIIESSASWQYFAHLEMTNAPLAYENSARIFFELADLGIDFIISHSLSQFNMLESNRAKLCASINRDNINLPMLFLPQVALLAMGEVDRSALGFNFHTNEVTLI